MGIGVFLFGDAINQHQVCLRLGCGSGTWRLRGHR
jgi:hypothetical protein